MKPTENLSRQIQSMVTLSLYWLKNLPEKPGKNGESEAREWDGLREVINKFIEFSTGYQAVLNKAPNIIQRFIINKGVENLLQRFSVINRACEQRRNTTNAEDPSHYLARAEEILEQYCNQWQGRENKEPYLGLSKPVVYFEKIFGINRARYAPEIPIISIPLTLYNRPDQWLALAHEMGHHFYWNSLEEYEDIERFQNGLISVLEKSSRSHSAIWKSWAEEVFADVCGTLLAGPDYAISCQDTAIERARKPADLAKDDGEHPAAYLRPLIALQVMRKIEKDTNSEVIRKIEERWNQYSKGVDDESLQLALTHPLTMAPNPTLRELASEIPDIVDSILTEAVWPGNKKLLDLINPYGKKEIEVTGLELDGLILVQKSIPKEISDLEGMVPYKQSGFIKTNDQDGEISGPNDDYIPESMKKLWKYFHDRLPSKEPSGLEKWEKLLDLSLDENHGHWLAGPHDSCQTHLIYALHRHDQGGSGNVIIC